MTEFYARGISIALISVKRIKLFFLVSRGIAIKDKYAYAVVNPNAAVLAFAVPDEFAANPVYKFHVLLPAMGVLVLSKLDLQVSVLRAHFQSSAPDFPFHNQLRPIANSLLQLIQK